MIKMYENFSNECEKLQQHKNITKQLFSSKDLICYLGTFIETEDLPNYFLVAKVFNENTNKNYHFWYKKLLKDFSYSYDSVCDLSIIQNHYRILCDLNRCGSYQAHLSIPQSHFTSLLKYIKDNSDKYLPKLQLKFAIDYF